MKLIAFLPLVVVGAVSAAQCPPARPEPSSQPSKHPTPRFKAGDAVEAFLFGEWTKSRILTVDGKQYNIQLPDGTKYWMRSDQIRQTPPPTPSGQPPKPGLQSCAGKIEGKYASSSGFPNIVFHSGKASIEGGEEVECWMGSGKLYLHTPGSRVEQDFAMDLLKDGSLDTPLGEIRKKGN